MVTDKKKNNKDHSALHVTDYIIDKFINLNQPF